MTKKKSIKMKRMNRTIKQYATFINEANKRIFFEVGERIKNAKNYMYSRLVGINSYLLLYAGNSIRDEWCENEQVTEDEKSYIRYVCSAPSLFGHILQRKTIHQLIRRYARKCRGRIPYTNKITFYLEAELWQIME